MDIADRSDEQDSIIIQNSIKQIRERVKKESLPITGYCYNCGAPCKAAFCDRECRDEYEHYLAALKRNGKLK